MASMGIKRLPTTLDEALKELEANRMLMDALGALLSSSYLASKRSEVTAYSRGSEEAEFADHFYKF